MGPWSSLWEGLEVHSVFCGLPWPWLCCSFQQLLITAMLLSGCQMTHLLATTWSKGSGQRLSVMPVSGHTSDTCPRAMMRDPTVGLWSTTLVNIQTVRYICWITLLAEFIVKDIKTLCIYIKAMPVLWRGLMSLSLWNWLLKYSDNAIKIWNECNTFNWKKMSQF